MGKLSPMVSALGAAQWHRCLEPHVLEGETITAFVAVRRLKPTVEGVAITNARILGFSSAAVSGSGVITIQVAADEILGAEFVGPRQVPTLTLRTVNGPRVFGQFHRDEKEFLTYFVESLHCAGVGADVAPALTRWRRQRTEAAERTRRRRAQRGRVAVYGEPMTEVQWEAIDEHAGDGDYPWMVLNAGRHGLLAAFGDRVEVRKTGWESGAAAGVHVEVLALTDITGIEYRCGALTGCLEFMTTDHPASVTGDFWPCSVQDSGHHSVMRPNVIRVPKPYYAGARAAIEALREQVGMGLSA
ncbi:hypothetical protein [Gordonia oryzae]|nr:hypothetical protein [Gordonia oryzae]